MAAAIWAFGQPWANRSNNQLAAAKRGAGITVDTRTSGRVMGLRQATPHRGFSSHHVDVPTTNLMSRYN